MGLVGENTIKSIFVIGGLAYVPPGFVFFFDCGVISQPVFVTIIWAKVFTRILPYGSIQRKVEIEHGCGHVSPECTFNAIPECATP